MLKTIALKMGPLFLSTALVSATTAYADTPAGVVFVLVDDVSYGDIDVLYPSKLSTPHLDNLYQQSVRLTDYHVNPVCAPTRAMIMTGRYPDASGIWHTIAARGLLSAEEQTIAEVFQENDWATGAFGKWHLGDGYPFSPRYRGFDTTVVHHSGGVSQTGDYWGNNYYSDVLFNGQPAVPDTYYANGEEIVSDQFVTDFFFDRTMDFIGESVENGEPFFAYLAPNAAHGPFNAPYGGPAGFDGLVENIDDNMGRLDAYLEELGIIDDVLVVFTTDNGTAGRDRAGGLRGRKSSEYDGGHRVPFFARWEQGGVGGATATARDIDFLTAGIDVMPTFMDMFDLERPNGGNPIHGISVADALQGAPHALEDRVYVMNHQQVVDRQLWYRVSVVFDEVENGEILHKWRLVRSNANASFELYDVINDRAQQNNIAAGHPDVVEALAAEYVAWFEETNVGLGYNPFEIDMRVAPEHTITSHDWLGVEISLWSQWMVAENWRTGTGTWQTKFPEAGRYRFELRRWPREDGGTINGPSLSRVPTIRGNGRVAKNVVLPIDEATLTLPGLGTFRTSVPVGAEAAFIEVEIPAGYDDQITAEFWDGGRRVNGVFFNYISRVSAAETPVTLFAQPNFGGDSWSVAQGEYTIADFRNSIIGNDGVSSISIAPGYEVTACFDQITRRNPNCSLIRERSAELGQLDDQISYVSVQPTEAQSCVATSDIARGGTAHQSSVLTQNEGRYGANLALDGDPTTFAHTEGEQSFATWEVTFDAPQLIDRVVLTNRPTGRSVERFRDLYVRVLTEEGFVAYASPLLNPENVLNSPEQIVINLPNFVEGHTIQVVREPDQDLSGFSTPGGSFAHDAFVLALSEVEVRGCPVP